MGGACDQKKWQTFRNMSECLSFLNMKIFIPGLMRFPCPSPRPHQLFQRLSAVSFSGTSCWSSQRRTYSVKDMFISFLSVKNTKLLNGVKRQRWPLLRSAPLRRLHQWLRPTPWDMKCEINHALIFKTWEREDTIATPTMASDESLILAASTSPRLRTQAPEKLPCRPCRPSPCAQKWKLNLLKDVKY